MISPHELHLEPSSMSSSDMSIILKQLESMSMTDHVRVLRHNKKTTQPRYAPYTLGTEEKQKKKQKEKQKEEAVQLGVELSFYVAEAMFLLSDDVRSMLVFCFWLFKYKGKRSFDGPVVGRVFRVIEYVFETYIKPKNGVYQYGGKSIQWEELKTFSYHFGFGVRVLARIVSILNNGDLVKWSGIEDYNQEMKKLKEKLRSVKNVCEGNGFAREVMESKFLHLWESLFETTPEVINPNKTIVLALFKPLLDEASYDSCSRRLASLDL